MRSPRTAMKSSPPLAATSAATKTQHSHKLNKNLSLLSPCKEGRHSMRHRETSQKEGAGKNLQGLGLC